MKKQKISIIGLGFVGLTLTVVSAQKGFKTIGIDNDNEKLKALECGKLDFFEPNVKNYLKKAIRERKIIFSSNIKEILKTDITFVTVGTPSTSYGKIDLSHINNITKHLNKVLEQKKGNHLVVIKSTVIPKTTSQIIYPKFKKLKNVNIVVNPEFLREGNAIHDLLHPHLIVIGESEQKAGNQLLKYYKNFYKKLPEILRTDFTTAEMIKYANNAFLATKISFINSIANICQRIPKADVKTVAYAIGKDPRIGPLFLNAGPGFGGSCLPKDLSALIEFSNKFDDANILLKTVRDVNKTQPDKLIKVMKQMKVLKKNKLVSILGLAFKKDTSDIRSSVSIHFVKKLMKNGLKVKVHDPMALRNFKKLFHDKIAYCETINNCLENSDCCVILTGWDEYKKLRPKDFNKMRQSNIIDAQRILSPKEFSMLNFKAIGLGT